MKLFFLRKMAEIRLFELKARKKQLYDFYISNGRMSDESINRCVARDLKDSKIKLERTLVRLSTEKKKVSLVN